jgi:MSHA biogenesis protein MshM
MYLQHFGLKQPPFTITPDTEFFMNRAGYQDALNVLLVALRSGEGFIKVTGEVGLGKTILCRKLLHVVRPEFVTSYIYNPYLNPDSILCAVADELGIKYEESIGQNALLKLLTAQLLKIHRAGKRVVLCLDEVQAMPIATLEALRLLTNIETEKRKLVQVVMFGQPELDSLLDHPAIRQLKQRITFSYKLLPLNKVAARHYVQHRLAVAGHTQGDLFSDTALTMLYQAARGTPRLINILCHKALMLAFSEGSRTVKPRHMQGAVEDTIEARQRGTGRFGGLLPGMYRWLFGSLGAVVTLGVGLEVLGRLT